MKRRVLHLLLFVFIGTLSAKLDGNLKIAALRVSFQEDNHPGTTGDGQFLFSSEFDSCGDYSIDPPPHDRDYFLSQLKAADNYFRKVSYGKFGLDLDNSEVYPLEQEGSYQLADSMSHYHRYGEDEFYEQQITSLLDDAVTLAYVTDGIDFSGYDLVVVFHAGVGQDFSLPFIDPTPEDIPSTFVDPDMISEFIGTQGIVAGGVQIEKGIILPETQNHLLYNESESLFSEAPEPCDYQYGMTGTFILMLGFALDLPPLWNIETGRSGIGIFGLMDQGSNNVRGLIPAPPNAWTRIFAGWEEPETVTPGNTVELPKRSKDAIIKIPINGDEYYLIENRSNWINDNVSLDSIRWQLYSESREEDPLNPRVTPLVEILFDSIPGIRDSNGVVTSIPDYDLGMPASGLLIWHIDEGVIADEIGHYSVNANPDLKGIDLEEADGAQDMGYETVHVFTDPSAGMGSDMWYQGNMEFERLFPELKGQPMEFGPYTFPDTRSNSGAATYISIRDIGMAADTMSFTVANSLVPDGFPGEDLGLKFVADLTGDGLTELIGGIDSLWWSASDPISKKSIISLAAQNYDLVLSNTGAQIPSLIMVADLGDSLKVTSFRYNSASDNLETIWIVKLNEAGFERISGVDNEDKALIYADTRIIHVSSSGIIVQAMDAPYQKNFTTVLYSDPAAGNDKSVYYNTDSEELVITESDAFFGSTGQPGYTEFSIIDLDLDGRAEIITADDENRLVVYNESFILEPGFPAELVTGDFILAGDLVDDDHPELVTQTAEGEIFITDWRGKLIYRLANSAGNNLKMLAGFRGKKSIISESMIWSFDSTGIETGNIWSRQHGDVTGSRRFIVSTAYTPADSEQLMDAAKTYAYPNPADEYVNLRIQVGVADVVSIKIYDLAGNYINEFQRSDLQSYEPAEFRWDVSDVESGVYFAYVEAKYGEEVKSKIIKIGVLH